MQRDYNTYLQDIIDAIQKIEKYTKNLSFENFLIDELIQDGVLKNLIIIGEAVKNIPFFHCHEHFQPFLDHVPLNIRQNIIH